MKEILRTRKPLFLKFFASLALALTFVGCVQNQSISANKPSVVPKDSIAIRGYDPVEYHLSEKAIRGNLDYNYVWNDQTWFFLSEENKKKFESNPTSYAPQFEGCCGVALSEGKALKGDPEVFSIYNEKLYLFSDEDKRELFAGDSSNRLESANDNYVKLFSSRF